MLPSTAEGIAVVALRLFSGLHLPYLGRMPVEHPPRLKRALQLFAGATFLGAFSASQQYLALNLQGERMPLIAVVIWALPFWYLWALLTPLVVWLARCIPLVTAHWASKILAHLAIASILAFFHSLVLVSIQVALQPAASGEMFQQPFWTLLVSFAAYELSLNLLAYGAIVGITYAIDFYRRFKERELAATQLSAQLSQAQLRALRMQLNPHFLFNTMNTIAMLVRKQESEEAVRTLAGLSDLLRYVLEDTRTHEVPLRQELEFVERYLAIEQVRFADRLNVRIDAEADTLDAHVPNLLLQPIVENAIRHGIARRAAASLVEVRARRMDDTLVLTVRDDGPGLLRQAEGVDDGVGLSNSRARLRQLYGELQSLDLTDSPTQGAIAKVILPFHTEPVTAPTQAS
ncbi:MAG: histidine kinase [Gemmatimonadota bacterium]|nr:MAG: histidine kinase [Gemmatimonadota bacterium]